MKWLIYGSRGWIGTQLCKFLTDEEVIHAEARADNEVDVEAEISTLKPDRVISLVGRTYGPGCNTIDYLEHKDRLVDNIRDNLYAPLTLAFICQKHNIHFTYIGTGCIFSDIEECFDPKHGYKEDSLPDFFGSSYSVVKGFTDRLMHQFDGSVLNLRIRMPCSNEINNRNYITKLMNYEYICSIPNSVTSLPELLPIAIDMAKNKVVGTINLTNPGVISHNEILEMVKEIHDPEFTWKNFSKEEQSKILKADRSNNHLNTDKLESMYEVMSAQDALRKLITELH